MFHSWQMHLEKTHSSIQNLFCLPDLQTILPSVGLTTIPGLPPGFPSQGADWVYFRKAVRKLWVMLRVVRATQQKAMKAERIRTCVECRCDLMKSDQGRMIRNLLGRQPSRVKLDKVSKAISGGGVQIIDEPAAVLQEVGRHFQQWTAKHQVQPLFGRWIDIYQPSTSINPGWYAGLMDPPSAQEVQHAVCQGPTGKAGGPTHITNEMIKHMGVRGQELFAVLCQRVISSAECPSAWKQGLIYPIPKSATWSGDLDAVRPITLLEHARKVCLSILTGRLSRICSKHTILHPNNFSVLKGSSIHEPLHALNALMEDARECKKEMWVILQDIKRAFDSVDWEMTQRSMERLCFPKEYIQLYASLTAQKTNQVITPFGLTQSYLAESGLDQGAVEAPLHWRISYDPLLWAMDKLAAGYTVNVAWKGPGPPALQSCGPVSVSSLAYVDDTVWVARSKSCAQRMLGLAMEFFQLNDIAINVKKTVLMVVNPTTDPTIDSLQFGSPALPLHPMPRSEGTRYLGCHISADGGLVTQRHLIDRTVTEFIGHLLSKQITDYQAVYLVNRVLVPMVLARCILMVPGQSECLSWTRQYLNLVKKKAKLPRDTPSEVLFHHRLYKLIDLYEAVSTMHITELWLHLNSPSSSLAGQLSRLRLLSLHKHRMTLESPVTNPTTEMSRHGINLIARTLPLMAERKIRFEVPSGWGAVAGGLVGISTLFGNWVKFQPHCSKFQHHGLIALEQMLSPDCKVLLSWKELRSLFPSLSFAVPQWFAEIESILGVHDHRRTIQLPINVVPATPNPFRTSQLDFPLLAADVGAFVIVFPESFPDDGIYFMARVIAWKQDDAKGIVSYHLQHWRQTEEQDSVDDFLSENGYYVQCKSDCGAPQLCETCQSSCCWWESSGVVDVSAGIWTGNFHHINFIGDDIVVREFMCVDMEQVDIDRLWRQLPDIVEEVLDCNVEMPVLPTLHPVLSVLCDQGGIVAPIWNQLQDLQDLEYTAKGLTVYTDGSLQGAGSQSCQAGAGFVVFDGEKPLVEIAIQLSGWVSSTKAEIYGCMAALVALPTSCPLQICTDSQGLIAGFQSFVTGADLVSPRRLLRNRFYREWAVLRQIIGACTAPVQLIKVKAHTGDFGNELADRLAKQGAVTGMRWTVSFHALPEIVFHPVHGEQHLVEGDLCTFLKMQSQLRVSVTWQYRKRVQANIRFFESVDWDSTIFNLHDGNLPGSLATSMSSCSSRAYRIKALHGMLPTAMRQYVTRPDLYSDDLCPRCLQAAESSEHLWQCNYSAEIIKGMIDEGTALFWGQAALLQKRPRVIGVEIFPGPHSVYDVVQGVVPLEWTTILHRCGLSVKRARAVVRKVGKFFVSAAHDRIWQPRCDVQITRERGLLITQKAKTGRKVRVGERSCRLAGGLRITHVTHVLAGLCPVCQLSYALHSGGECPSLVLQAPVIADRLLRLHHQSLYLLPYIHSSSIAVKALDSASVLVR
jgi:ribonuclease HI